MNQQQFLAAATQLMGQWWKERRQPDGFLNFEPNEREALADIYNFAMTNKRLPTVDEFSALVAKGGDIRHGGKYVYAAVAEADLMPYPDRYQQLTTVEAAIRFIRSGKGIPHGDLEVINAKLAWLQRHGKHEPKVEEQPVEAVQEKGPKLNSEQMAVKQQIDAETNFIMNGLLDQIRRYAGKSHSTTEKRRTELYAIFDKFKSQVKSPEDARKMANTINQRIDQWDSSSVY